MNVNDENAPPPDTDDFQQTLTNSLIYEGYSFARKHTAKLHTLYWRKFARSQACPVKIRKYSTNNRVVILGTGTHSDGCKNSNGIGEAAIINDFTCEMKEMVEDLSLSNLALRPKEVRRQVSTEMNRRSRVWKGLTDKSVIRMVGNVHEKAHGGDIFRTLESTNLSMVKDSPFYFLQCNVCLSDPGTHKMEKLIVYGNTTLFGILKAKKVQIYIDATFYIKLGTVGKLVEERKKKDINLATNLFDGSIPSTLALITNLRSLFFTILIFRERCQKKFAILSLRSWGFCLI